MRTTRSCHSSRPQAVWESTLCSCVVLTSEDWRENVLGGCRGMLSDVDVTQLQHDVSSLKSQMAHLRSTINTLQSQLNATSALAALSNSQPHRVPVAFTAHLTTTITNIPAHQHVAFDHVITNIGDAYSATTGHFVAPVFGTYAFFITATNIPGHSTSLSLMKNGVWQAVTLAHGSSVTPSQWETSTMCTMLLLNSGDNVWAQNEAQFSPTEDLDGHYYSSISGFLIHQL